MTRGTLATVMMDPEDSRGLEAAIATARRLSLHLEVLCLSPAAFHLPPPTMGDAFMPPVILQDHTAELEACEAAVTDRMAREDVEWSVMALSAVSDALSTRLTQRLRFCDIVLLPRSGAVPADLMRLFENILYQSRVPILLTDAAPRSFDRVMVAWDESDVALAAIRAADAVLSVAKEVEIVTVGLPGAGEDLARMLARRGTAPLLTPLPRGGEAISGLLLDHARATGADLIVAGAYGHARLREIVLGGVTRDLLRQAGVPLLLAR